MRIPSASVLAIIASSPDRLAAPSPGRRRLERGRDLVACCPPPPLAADDPQRGIGEIRLEPRCAVARDDDAVVDVERVVRGREDADLRLHAGKNERLDAEIAE